MLLFAASRSRAGRARVAGHMHHTAAVGDLVTSLYAAGCAACRAGPDDPAPGVPSIRAVMPKLNLRRLGQVVEIDPDGAWVIAQARCRLSAIALLLADQGLALAPGPGPGGPTRDRPARPARPARTAGAAVICGLAEALWVDVLTASGEITRHRQDALPPDALVVAAALATTKSPAAEARGARETGDARPAAAESVLDAGPPGPR
ncbi:MAG: hypothetical protein LBD90_09490 [Bifidobacteriaceae bacterium]|jgi:hypothetical protein|nr:hypothetical protein [Bifidobacteriaceae bacterium]